jgi:hypothetical protein
MRELEDLKCHMIFEWNSTMQCFNGYLVKSDGTLGYIKAFLYKTEEDCYLAGLEWANNNPRRLKNSGYGTSFQQLKEVS